jgi:hypothetical protein
MNVMLDAQITDASVKNKTPSGKRYHAVNHVCDVLKKKTNQQATDVETETVFKV